MLDVNDLFSNYFSQTVDRYLTIKYVMISRQSLYQRLIPLIIHVVTMVIVPQNSKCNHRSFHYFEQPHFRPAVVVRQAFHSAVCLGIEYKLIRFYFSRLWRKTIDV